MIPIPKHRPVPGLLCVHIVKETTAMPISLNQETCKLRWIVVTTNLSTDFKTFVGIYQTPHLLIMRIVLFRIKSAAFSL
jgi:hypothetical protein